MRARLSILYLFQFSVWGCYLSCLGQFLGAGGLGAKIAWFYAAIGVVSIVTPSLFGKIADGLKAPHRLLSVCHLFAGIFMIILWRYGMTHPILDFITTYFLYISFLAFYMPTMALANTVSFRLLEKSGLSTVSSFPKIRIWGTIGFIAAMWFVNSAYWDGGALRFTLKDSADPEHLRFQYNAMQLLCSGIMAFVTSIYASSLPASGTPHELSGTEEPNDGLRLFGNIKRMFGCKEIAIFLIFVVLSGVCLQISNGFATPYISHFLAFPVYADSLAAGNATLLFSLSQVSEAFCILLVGVALKRKGIGWVYSIGLLAWGLRFIMFGLGNPADGLWLLVGSMLIYGVAFNFITIAGHLYIQQITPKDMKGFSQGVMMLMSNGIGATVGIFIAGDIVNYWCHWEIVECAGFSSRLFMGDWFWPWLIFACYALTVALVWIIVYRKFFKPEKARNRHVQSPEI